MNEKIKQPTQTRPVGSDMTMDEILSSIRKIISTEDHLQSEPVIKAKPQQAPHVVEETKIRVPLSSKEQLKSLSTPLSDDMNVMTENWKTSQRSPEKPHNSLLDQIAQQAESFKVDPNAIYKDAASQISSMPKSQQSDETSEILKTLEEIRKSLSVESLQKASKAISEDVITEQPKQAESPVAITEDAILENVQVHEPAQIQNIDFKPVHFGQDDIPDFLKKFKKEQSEPQNIAPTEDTESYNFKEIQSFEDDDAIMELTEALKDPAMLGQIAEKATLELPAPQEKIVPVPIEKEASSDDDGMSDVLEMLMIKSLRPMLKEWVEDNISDIAQKVLREELQKRGQKSRT